MRLSAHLALFFAVATSDANLHAQAAPAHESAPAKWLLTYAGKSTNALMWNTRFRTFLRAHVTAQPQRYWGDKPSIPSQDALQFLGGPPDDVTVLENRYLIASACVPHDCTERGLLWVDTQTAATIFAPATWDQATPAYGDASRHRLFLFTNKPLQQSTLPPTLIDAIAHWSAQPNGDGTSHSIIGSVIVFQPNNTRLTLTPAAVHAWTPKTATPKEAR